MKTILCMAALGLLTACASTSIRYYSLTPALPPSHATSSPSAAPDFAIRLSAVRVPGQVDRPQLVVRNDSSTAVTVLNQSLWAAPLVDEIRAALAQELTRVLAVPDVSLMVAPAGLPVWTIAVQVHRFEFMAGAWTVLDASWTLSRASALGAASPSASHDAVAQICSTVIQMPVKTGGVEPLVDAQRAAVIRLADAIAESISTPRSQALSQVEINKGCTYS